MSPDTVLRITRRPEPRALRLHDDDPIAVALAPLANGTSFALGDTTHTAHGDIPRGHKVALRALAAGEPVRKYGEVIGVATTDIAAGTHVHTHNLTLHDVAAEAAQPAIPRTLQSPPATFDGIVRADGRTGTRNYIVVVSTVNCSASIAKLIAARAEAAAPIAGRDDIDGVIAITHSSGCGLAADGEGLRLLRRTLLGYARHPNVAAVLVIGLGCEVNEIELLAESGSITAAAIAAGSRITGGSAAAQSHAGSGTTEPLTTASVSAAAPAPAASSSSNITTPPIRTLTIQDAGGTTAAIRAGVAAVIELAANLPRTRRTPVPASALTLALKCGGSDGYSGLTANPALGVAADLLIAQGGTAVLGETPEIFGAQHLLAARAADPAVAERLLGRVEWWREHAAADGTSLDQNPSPGNRRGGITTIAEKSLGAVAKSGSSPLRAVVDFAEPVTAPGLTFMDTPGYDPVSVTGLIAGGATVVCFTTGRGSVFGSRPAPSLKLATNSELYARMTDDMDLDCGAIAYGDATVEEVGRQIFELVLRTASGRRTRSELLGFGQEEFVPWQRGIVL
jgi:altronate hydrolase